MTTARDLMEAEQELRSVQNALSAVRADKEQLVRYPSVISFNGNGRTFKLNEHASAELLALIEASFERQVLNLTALLRKHNLSPPPAEGIVCRMNMEQLRARLANTRDA